MDAVALFALIACIGAYIVWCDERDQFELAVKHAHENGYARFVYVMSDDLIHSPSIATFKLVIEVFDFTGQRKERT